MPLNQAQAPEAQEPFIPLAALENALRYWWIAALLMILGGLTGLLVHSFRPALYESTAQFSVAIDYVSTGPLTQYDEDLAINTAGHLFGSLDVLQAVVDQANAEGIATNLTELRSRAVLERNFSIWNIRVRNPDPHNAKRLTAIWMNVGQSFLEEGYQHAIQAQLLERYIQSQANCLERLGANQPINEPCSSATFAGIQANLKAAGDALNQERMASQGLFSGLTLGPFNPPNTSPQLVTFGRGQFVFLGGLLGLILGLAAIEIGMPILRKTKS